VVSSRASFSSLSEGVLKHCVESGGKNNLLPRSFEACQKVAEGLIATVQGKRKTCVIDIPIPLEVRLLVRILRVHVNTRVHVNIYLRAAHTHAHTHTHTWLHGSFIFLPPTPCSWWTPIRALSASNSKIRHGWVGHV
jgi:hypothetical protein